MGSKIISVIILSLILIIGLVAIAYAANSDDSANPFITESSPAPVTPGSSSSSGDNSDALKFIKDSGKGVKFSDSADGGIRATFTDENNLIKYKDIKGKEVVMSGIATDKSGKNYIEFNKKGELVSGSYKTVKSATQVFGGNLAAYVPENTKVDIKNGIADISLGDSSKVISPPKLVYPSEDKGNLAVNYHADKKPGVKFSSEFSEGFNLQGGTLSHDGKNYFVDSGKFAWANGVGFNGDAQGADNKGAKANLFFNSEPPKDFSKSYTHVDLKKGIVESKSVNNEIGPSIRLTKDNPIVSVSDKNSVPGVGLRVDQNGFASIVGTEKTEVPSIASQGRFTMDNGPKKIYYDNGKLSITNLPDSDKTATTTSFLMNNKKTDGTPIFVDKEKGPMIVAINDKNQGGLIPADTKSDFDKILSSAGWKHNLFDEKNNNIIPPEGTIPPGNKPDGTTPPGNKPDGTTPPGNIPPDKVITSVDQIDRNKLREALDKTPFRVLPGDDMGKDPLTGKMDINGKFVLGYLKMEAGTGKIIKPWMLADGAGYKPNVGDTYTVGDAFRAFYGDMYTKYLAPGATGDLNAGLAEMQSKLKATPTQLQAKFGNDPIAPYLNLLSQAKK